MTDNIRGRTHRVRTPTLPTFLNSDAPETLKTKVQDILGKLAHLDTLDETALRERNPELLARILASSAAGLEFIRVLRGELPLKTTYSRRNVSASLRQKLRERDEMLCATDYPLGHYVPVMAWAYWGSVERWVKGRPGRRCLPKGYWQQRGNQLAALLDWAEAHPGAPITHAALHEAGLHTLASTLDAAALDALATELGLQRNLKLRPDGYWTPTVTIDTYAELCRTREITLSSSALAAIGGDGFILRGRAKKHFGSFADFQAAMVKRHPDIKLPNRPTARDGRRLDSWQEVVVYNALRRAVPAAVIDTHVLLANTRRSCDLVLNGQVYVEVLRIGKAEMASPRNAAARKYRDQWLAKMEVYRAMGVTPISIEPEELHDPERLATRVAEVAAHLNMQMVPLPPPSGKVLRPKRYWDFGTLCAAVAEVAAAVGGFPTFAQLSAAGYGHATMLLRGKGMRARVAAEIGHALRHEKGIWSEEKVISELAAWAGEHGRYPTGNELATDGKHLLHGARRRLFAGRLDELRSLVEQRCGLVLPRRSAAPGSYDTIEQLASLLQPICDELGRFPTGVEMNARLPETVYSEVSRRIGLPAMAEFMGVRYTGPRSLTTQQALALFRDVCAGQGLGLAVGLLPKLTTTQITRALGSRGIALMQRRFGNIAGLRAALAVDSSKLGTAEPSSGTSGETDQD